MGGVELFEQFSKAEEGGEDDGDFILKVGLVDEPTISNDDVVDADDPYPYCFQIDDILSDLVPSPVDDGEDEQDQCDDRFDDPP